MLRSSVHKRSLSCGKSLMRNFASKTYDVAIIGGGPGGYVAAIKAAQLGLKTACIEKRGKLGGTCLNVGCIPSKALLNSTHKYHEAKEEFKAHGINFEGLSYDWGKQGLKVGQIQAQKDKAVTSLTSGIEFLFKKNKVDYLKGFGRFSGKESVEVLDDSGKAESIQAKNIIIATGSAPANIPGGILPIDEKRVVSSTGAISLPKVPKKMVVIGGGVIGLEMGSVYSRLGTEVTVVEFLDKILPPMDNQISKKMQQILKKQGMQFKLSHKVVGGEVKGDSVLVEMENLKNGKKQQLETEYVLVATGRIPYTEGLQLDKVGVDTDARGRINVDLATFQTKQKGVYAIGDVIQGPMLAHKAEEDGIACAQNLAGLKGHVNYDTVPGVVYTYPEVAQVGKTEEELKKEGVQFVKGSFPFSANSRAKTNSDFEGFVKILTDKKTDKILGIHVIGPNAGEMIAEGVLGMEYGAAAEDIGRTCHAHPTLSEAFKEACMSAYDKPIHM